MPSASSSTFGTTTHGHESRRWLRRAAQPVGPYWVLALYGEMGSAKTTIARMLTSLIDPATPALRSDPRDIGDFVIAAQSRWVVGLDNVSHISPWLSDAACRLAVGGGYAKRELYSDADEVLFEATRPQLMTGITEYITRSDLVDRAMQETFLAIPSHRRRRESDLNAAFETARPLLVGALFDDLAAGLRAAPDVKLTSLPRTADCAAWAVAVETGRGEDTRFMLAYWSAIDAAHLQAIEAERHRTGMLKLLEDLAAFGTVWEGTAEELLEKLGDLAGVAATKARGWPRGGRSIAGELTRLAPALRGIGVTLKTGRREARTGRRLIEIHAPKDRPVSANGEKETGSSDDGGAQPSPSSPCGFSSSDQEGVGVTIGSSPIVTGEDSIVTADGPVTQGDDPGDDLTRKGDDGDDAAAHVSEKGSRFDRDAVTIVLTTDDARQAVVMLGSAPVLGLDTETTGLDPRSQRVRLVQLASPDGRVYVFDLFRLDPQLLAPLFDPATGPVLVGHNLKFDLQFLAEAGLPVPNGTRLFDQPQAVILLDPGVQAGPGQATPPDLVLEAQGPGRMARGQADQAVARTFFRAYSGSGLVIHCLARFQRTPEAARSPAGSSRH